MIFKVGLISHHQLFIIKDKVDLINHSGHKTKSSNRGSNSGLTLARRDNPELSLCLVKHSCNVLGEGKLSVVGFPLDLIEHHLKTEVITLSEVMLEMPDLPVNSNKLIDKHLDRLSISKNSSHLILFNERLPLTHWCLLQLALDLFDDSIDLLLKNYSKLTEFKEIDLLLSLSLL